MQKANCVDWEQAQSFGLRRAEFNGSIRFMGRATICGACISLLKTESMLGRRIPKLADYQQFRTFCTSHPTMAVAYDDRTFVKERHSWGSLRSPPCSSFLGLRFGTRGFEAMRGCRH